MVMFVIFIHSLGIRSRAVDQSTCTQLKIVELTTEDCNNVAISNLASGSYTLSRGPEMYVI